MQSDFNTPLGKTSVYIRHMQEIDSVTYIVTDQTHKMLINLIDHDLFYRIYDRFNLDTSVGVQYAVFYEMCVNR